MSNHLERYHAMLAGRGMKVGDQVVCTYRSPAPNQWWIAPWHVGVIEEPLDDPNWRSGVLPSYGSKSEAYFCANYRYVKVRYLGHGEESDSDARLVPGFVERDELAYLLQLHGDPVTESPWFGSDPAEAIRLFHFACRAGLDERYAEASQKAWHELNRRGETK
jgi:hypothetical protein